MQEEKRYKIDDQYWHPVYVDGRYAKVKGNLVIADENFIDRAVLKTDLLADYDFNRKYLRIRLWFKAYDIDPVAYVMKRYAACKFDGLTLCEGREAEIELFPSLEKAENIMAVLWFKAALNEYDKAGPIKRFFIRGHLRRFAKSKAPCSAALHEEKLIASSRFPEINFY